MRGLARLVYRDIDVRRPESAIAEGPVLAVANHFGGLSDGVLLIDASPRMPRVIARDLIWKVPVAGQLATAIGMIPVHRAATVPAPATTRPSPPPTRPWVTATSSSSSPRG